MDNFIMVKICSECSEHSQTGLTYGSALAYAHACCARCLNEQQMNTTFTNHKNLNLQLKICKSCGTGSKEVKANSRLWGENPRGAQKTGRH